MDLSGIVKPLEWEDADQGMCTKWRAPALHGAYELVLLDKEDGLFSVNFHWGRPFSFWFIQGDPDEWGPTGPQKFPTIEAAKAAAQADYEARILAAIDADAVARLVQEAVERERERCAGIADACERQNGPLAKRGLNADYQAGLSSAGQAIAAAIRKGEAE